MNYRHLFHAGNFADVFKHVALLLLLRALHKKDTPFCYLDTHAGIGRYDLAAAAAQRSGEYRDGIARLWDAPVTDTAVRDYLAAVRTENPDGQLRVYPGSPLIALGALRAQDRMVLCERHPEEYRTLRDVFARERQVAVHERDGYEALGSLLPPKERRGLVLIDPPFEIPDEFGELISGLTLALSRWQTGIYAVWFPIKDRRAVEHFYAGLQRRFAKVVSIELMLFPEDTSFRLNGCGLVVLNPPWQFASLFAAALAQIEPLLKREPPSRTSVVWLAGQE
jgi:23S rRNA (adenine2030-N6)-methyltransferase